MDSQLLYNYGIATELILAPIVFISLFFITASYGRHWKASWGPNLNPRIGWVLMELPCVVLFAGVYFQGVTVWRLATLTLFGLWELHYLQRTFVHPVLMRLGKSSMSVSVVAMGLLFNVINAPLNALALTHFSPSYSDGWLIDPRFIVGTVIFLVGFTINVYSDHILRNLRKPGETGYKIPYGGLFRWVTSPNYFGEIVEWCGWALATWSLAGVAFAAFTFANLAPRARAHHLWYLSNFSGYPKKRKAMIPKLF